VDTSRPLHLFARKHEQHAAAGVFLASELAAQHGANGNGGVAHVEYRRADPAAHDGAPVFVVQHLATEATVDSARDAKQQIDARCSVGHPLYTVDHQARAGRGSNTSGPLKV